MLKVHQYKDGPALLELKKKVSEIYPFKTEDIFLTMNGRSGFMLFLRSLKLDLNDEVILPAFTCSVMSAAIISSGVKPIYVDVNDDLTMSFEDIRAKITNNTKVIVVQHTYGQETDVKEIRKLIGDRDIYIVEDCAQCLGFKDKEGGLLGTKGDIGLFSFGYNKVLPTRVGGFISVNNPQLRGNVENEFKRIKFASRWHTFRWLLNPFIWRIARLFGISKTFYIARYFKKLGLLDLGLDRKEIFGKIPSRYPTKLSNPLAAVTFSFLSELQSNLDSRRDVTMGYRKAISELKSERDINFRIVFESGDLFQKFPVEVDQKISSKELAKSLKECGFNVYEATEIPLITESHNDICYPTENLNSNKIAKNLIYLPTDSMMDDVRCRELVFMLASKIDELKGI